MHLLLKQERQPCGQQFADTLSQDSIPIQAFQYIHVSFLLIDAMIHYLQELQAIIVLHCHTIELLIL